MRVQRVAIPSVPVPDAPVGAHRHPQPGQCLPGGNRYIIGGLIVPELMKKVVKVPGRTVFNGKKPVSAGVPFDLPEDQADQLIRLGHVRLYVSDAPPAGKTDPDGKPDA